MKYLLLCVIVPGSEDFAGHENNTYAFPILVCPCKFAVATFKKARPIDFIFKKLPGLHKKIDPKLVYRCTKFPKTQHMRSGLTARLPAKKLSS